MKANIDGSSKVDGSIILIEAVVDELSGRAYGGGVQPRVRFCAGELREAARMLRKLRKTPTNRGQ